MTYKETLEYLYARTPAFHLVGGSAYKPGLERSLALDSRMRYPHRSFRSIHVAGTNGKGSVSHLIAAILTEAKYRVGLYTSPHLVDFCERIRVNGKKISAQYVVDFVARHKGSIETLEPSFFELTSGLAFDFFRHKRVDFAIIETGLGGRLDSTNIIRPILSVITNISKDHTQYLGNTLPQIAAEKAGIIKYRTPVIVGEAWDESVRQVLVEKAKEREAPIFFTNEKETFTYSKLINGQWRFQSPEFGSLVCELGGLVQKQNVQTVLKVMHMLQIMNVRIPQGGIRRAMEKVTELTGLMGRWQTLHQVPRVICDTGHNAGAWQSLSTQLRDELRYHSTLRMVVGLSKDKAVQEILALMPFKAVYYYTQASTSRALPTSQLEEEASLHGLSGSSYDTVMKAVNAALKDADEKDLIFIGGSNFVVAEAIPLFPAAYKP
jgi:dihydrofolate synthase/folylpolyglutamate synthase